VMQANKQCNAHWERNLRQYALRAEPLFDVFTSEEALRWTLFMRNIDARAGSSETSRVRMNPSVKPVQRENWACEDYGGENTSGFGGRE